MCQWLIPASMENEGQHCRDAMPRCVSLAAAEEGLGGDNGDTVRGRRLAVWQDLLLSEVSRLAGIKCLFVKSSDGADPSIRGLCFK